jgi:uncharacterized protein (TIGR03435 family)
MNLKLIGVAFTITVASIHAQKSPSAKPEFEVASIKPTSPDERGGGYRFEPGGRALVTNFTLKNMIQVAWHLQAFQTSGGAPWLDSERFNIEAKAEGNPSEDESRVMLQLLLSERFHLVLHRETRELRIYALVRAKSGDRLGAGLTTSKEGSCVPATADFPLPPGPGKPPSCGFKERLRRDEKGAALIQLQGLGVPLSLLARSLGSALERHVADDTGLSGNFDLNLEYVPDGNRLAGLISNTQPLDTAGPSLFTALQEQLGLRLESRKGPVEVFVIDHAERPSEN